MAIESDLLASAPGTACVRIPPLAPGGTHSTRIVLATGAADVP
jgi:hypothetical protein